MSVTVPTMGVTSSVHRANVQPDRMGVTVSRGRETPAGFLLIANERVSPRGATASWSILVEGCVVCETSLVTKASSRSTSSGMGKYYLADARV